MLLGQPYRLVHYTRLDTLRIQPTGVLDGCIHPGCKELDAQFGLLGQNATQSH